MLLKPLLLQQTKSLQQQLLLLLMVAPRVAGPVRQEQRQQGQQQGTGQGHPMLRLPIQLGQLVQLQAAAGLRMQGCRKLQGWHFQS